MALAMQELGSGELQCRRPSMDARKEDGLSKDDDTCTRSRSETEEGFIPRQDASSD